VGKKRAWIGQIVVNYHRTIEHYFNSTYTSWFSVLDLREGTPKREHFSSEEEFIRRQGITILLAFSCLK